MANLPLRVRRAPLAGIRTVDTPWGRSGLLPGRLWLKNGSPKSCQVRDISSSLEFMDSVQKDLRSPELPKLASRAGTPGPECGVDLALYLSLEPSGHYRCRLWEGRPSARSGGRGRGQALLERRGYARSWRRLWSARRPSSSDGSPVRRRRLGSTELVVIVEPPELNVRAFSL